MQTDPIYEFLKIQTIFAFRYSLVCNLHCLWNPGIFWITNSSAHICTSMPSRLRNGQILPCSHWHTKFFCSNWLSFVSTVWKCCYCGTHKKGMWCDICLYLSTSFLWCKDFIFWKWAIESNSMHFFIFSKFLDILVYWELFSYHWLWFHLELRKLLVTSKKNIGWEITNYLSNLQ